MDHGVVRYNSLRFQACLKNRDRLVGASADFYLRDKISSTSFWRGQVSLGRCPRHGIRPALGTPRILRWEAFQIELQL